MWGFILAAFAFRFIYPMFGGDGTPDFRLASHVLSIGVVPALLALWIAARVPESPVWLAAALGAVAAAGRDSNVPRIVRPSFSAI